MRVYVQGESITFGAPPISAEGEGGDRGGKRDKGSFGLVEGREEATARGQTGEGEEKVKEITAMRLPRALSFSSLTHQHNILLTGLFFYLTAGKKKKKIRPAVR